MLIHTFDTLCRATVSRMSCKKDRETEWAEFTKEEDAERCPQGVRQRLLHNFDTEDIYTVIGTQKSASHEMVMEGIEEASQDGAEGAEAVQFGLLIEDLKTLLLNEYPRKRYNEEGNPTRRFPNFSVTHKPMLHKTPSRTKH